MSILFIQKDPRKCALQHSDTHVESERTHYIRILVTALKRLDKKQDLSRKQIELMDKDDSAVVWASKCYANFHWLWCLTMYLVEEHKIRFSHNKLNKRWEYLNDRELILVAAKAFVRKGTFEGRMTKPPLIKKNCKIGVSVVDCYREYYTELDIEKTYTNRRVPKWLR